MSLSSRLDLVLVTEYDEEIPGGASHAATERYFTEPVRSSRIRACPAPQQLNVVALGTWLRARGFSVSRGRDAAQSMIQSLALKQHRFWASHDWWQMPLTGSRGNWATVGVAAQ